jgi:uncharacterized membrane protein (UPF0127 family)
MRGDLRRRLRHRGLPLLLAVWLVAACGDGTPPPVPEARLPVEWIRVGPHRVSAEIAVDLEDRRRGLMFRESLPADHGMLFIFPEEQVLAFWMRNTKLPLSIAYADADGTIVRIADLEPLDERGVTSMGPALYALEMNRGWFRAHEVGVGDRIEGIPNVGAR